ncbi:putative Acid phosphatase [Helianthus debilis subsp. tardiflorus]
MQDVDVALKESSAKWKVVVGHHTIYSAGVHGNTEELVDKLLPILLVCILSIYIYFDKISNFM